MWRAFCRMNIHQRLRDNAARAIDTLSLMHTHTFSVLAANKVYVCAFREMHCVLIRVRRGTFFLRGAVGIGVYIVCVCPACARVLMRALCEFPFIRKCVRLE